MDDSRQDYNWGISDAIFLGLYPDFIAIQTEVNNAIDAYPNQRFGQIICNYICPDYRSEHVSTFTKIFMKTIFPNNPDPFFEESKETYERLVY